jgi:hypothetical protein
MTRRQSKRNNMRRQAMIPSNSFHKSGLPTILTQIQTPMTLRFSVGGANPTNTYPISIRNVMDCIFTALSTTTGSPVFDSFRIKRFRIWCNGPTNAPTTVGLYMSGNTGIAGDTKAYSATSIGVEPAFLEVKPEKDSNVANWLTSGSGSIFSIVVPPTSQGVSIVDIELDYRVISALSPVSVASAGVAMTAGQIYYRGLDGLGATSSNFTPLGDIAVA